MVCCVLPVPEPLSRMLWVAYRGAVALRVLSVSTSDPLKIPPEWGVKLMGNKQDCPACSAPTVEEPALTSGHSDVPVLFKLKFDEMTGLLPILGIGKLSVALPTFSRVTVCGLSLLVDLGDVNAKLRVGGSAKSSINT